MYAVWGSAVTCTWCTSVRSSFSASCFTRVRNRILLAMYRHALACERVVHAWWSFPVVLRSVFPAYAETELDTEQSSTQLTKFDGTGPRTCIFGWEHAAPPIAPSKKAPGTGMDPAMAVPTRIVALPEVRIDQTPSRRNKSLRAATPA